MEKSPRHVKCLIFTCRHISLLYKSQLSGFVHQNDNAIWFYPWLKQSQIENTLREQQANQCHEKLLG